MKNQATLKVFPNPAKKSLTVEFEVGKTENIQIDLFDVNGKKVSNLFNERARKGKHRFQKAFTNNTFSKGIYFIVMQNKEGIIGRKKVVFN